MIASNIEGEKANPIPVELEQLKNKCDAFINVVLSSNENISEEDNGVEYVIQEEDIAAISIVGMEVGIPPTQCTSALLARNDPLPQPVFLFLRIILF